MKQVRELSKLGELSGLNEIGESGGQANDSVESGVPSALDFKKNETNKLERLSWPNDLISQVVQVDHKS